VIAIGQRRTPDQQVPGNAGVFPANSIVGREEALSLQKRFRDSRLTQSPQPILPALHTLQVLLRKQGPAMKLPAAWLIERAGWKGVRQGDAGVHADMRSFWSTTEAPAVCTPALSWKNSERYRCPLRAQARH